MSVNVKVAQEFIQTLNQTYGGEIHRIKMLTDDLLMVTFKKLKDALNILQSKTLPPHINIRLLNSEWEPIIYKRQSLFEHSYTVKNF